MVLYNAGDDYNQFMFYFHSDVMFYMGKEATKP